MGEEATHVYQNPAAQDIIGVHVDHAVYHYTYPPLPPSYHRYFKQWFALGVPVFISLLLVFYLMVVKSFSL